MYVEPALCGVQLFYVHFLKMLCSVTVLQINMHVSNILVQIMKELLLGHKQVVPHLTALLVLVGMAVPWLLLCYVY